MMPPPPVHSHLPLSLSPSSRVPPGEKFSEGRRRRRRHPAAAAALEIEEGGLEAFSFRRPTIELDLEESERKTRRRRTEGRKGLSTSKLSSLPSSNLTRLWRKIPLSFFFFFLQRPPLRRRMPSSSLALSGERMGIERGRERRSNNFRRQETAGESGRNFFAQGIDSLKRE